MTLDELEKLEKVATPGTWEVRQTGDLLQIYSDYEPPEMSFCILEYTKPEDAAFIAAFRNAAPKLLAVARAARSMIEYVNPMWLETDPPMVEMRKALEALEK